MKTLKESILDKDFDFDDFDPKTPFEKALVKFFNTVRKDDEHGRMIYVDPRCRLIDNIYSLAKEHLKPISRQYATKKNKCALRICVSSSYKSVQELSFDNNPDGKYIDMYMACICISPYKTRMIATHGQQVECFAIDSHTFNLLKYLIDDL